MGRKVGDIDFVIVRENTEDLYLPIRGSITRGGNTEMSVDVRVITRKGSERVIDHAFKLATRRKRGAPSDGKKRVTCIDKSNVLLGCRLFRDIYDEIAPKYPDIEKDYAYIDAWTQWVIRKPEFFNVCVTTNVFGDIITDLAGAIQGSLGLAGAANIGDNYAYFEAIHGSAPKYAGKNVADPCSMILSSSMMLDWMGEKYSDEKLSSGGRLIEDSLAAVLKEGKIRTYDLGGTSSTKEFGDAIAQKIKFPELVV